MNHLKQPVTNFLKKKKWSKSKWRRIKTDESVTTVYTLSAEAHGMNEGICFKLLIQVVNLNIDLSFPST